MSYNPDVKHSRDADPALPPRRAAEADQTLAALLRSPATAPALHVPDGLRLDFGGLAEAAGNGRCPARCGRDPRGWRGAGRPRWAGAGPGPAGRRLARGGGRPAEPGIHPRRVRLLYGGPGRPRGLRSFPPARPRRPEQRAASGRRRRAPRRGRPPARRALDGRVVRTPKDFEPAQPDDVALLLHTSGTTSRPKQVPLSTVT